MYRRPILVSTIVAMCLAAAAMAQAGKCPTCGHKTGMSAADQGARKHKAKDDAKHKQTKDRPTAERHKRIQADPEGWVLISYDTDLDGRPEAVEYISAIELERARRASRERLEDERRQARGEDERGRYRRGRPRRRDEMGQQMAFRRRRLDPEELAPRQARRPVMRARGTIHKIRSIDLVGEDESHRIAHIETEKGNRVRVDLGPKSDFDRLNLREGDRITVFGARGTINEKPMLMAHEIHARGQRVVIERKRGPELRRFAANVLKTYTTSFKGRKHDYAIAKVRLHNGDLAMVNLGPKPELKGLEIERGDRIRMLARPITIDDRPALYAERITVAAARDIDRRPGQAPFWRN